MEYNIILQKSTELLYTINEQSKNEIQKEILFSIASKRMKYLRINLPMQVTDFYAENERKLVKEFEEYINKWRDISYSWIERYNIFNMLILPKVVYRFNEILVKVPMTFFDEIVKPIIKFTWKLKGKGFQTIKT